MDGSSDVLTLERELTLTAGGDNISETVFIVFEGNIFAVYDDSSDLL
jgi:hypothetical protein